MPDAIAYAGTSVYLPAYLACAALASAALLSRFAKRISPGRDYLSALLIAPLMIVYLLGMYRSGGQDYDNYLSAYNDQGVVIPDLGYIALTWATRQLGVDFSTFLFCQGLLTIAALWHVAKHRDADPFVVIAIYLLHLAIGRDLSQSRIGLAVVLYLLGHTQRGWLARALCYIAAASIHITVLVLACVWAAGQTSARLTPGRRLLLIYLPTVVLATFGTTILDLASFVDPRVELYLSWEEEGFGSPIASYGALGRSVVVLIIYIAAAGRFRRLPLQPFIFMEFAGAAVLLGLADYSVFAARLSNVAVSLYPVGIGMIAAAYQSEKSTRRTLVQGITIRLALVAMFVILLARPASVETLEAIVPVAFERMAAWD